jgi:hypothetical protein
MQIVIHWKPKERKRKKRKREKTQPSNLFNTFKEAVISLREHNP